MKKAFLLVPFLGLALIANPQADNTKANKNDSVTAEDQSNHKNDLELSKEIRREITKDSNLSTYAHNVKIIVKNGVVTLKGPVKNTEEKLTIESIAQQKAGAAKVVSHLKVVKS